MRKPTNWKNEALISNSIDILWTGVVVKIIKMEEIWKWESRELFFMVKPTKTKNCQKWNNFIYIFITFVSFYELAWTLFLNYDFLKVCAGRVVKNDC